MEINFLADFLLSIGSLTGVIVKMDGLLNENTSWPRRSSGLNVVSYPFTALIPFYLLQLWFTFTISLVNFLIWIGIFIYRPEK